MVKIITFYSYKGGVGRTQLLANLASYLTIYKNKKVLIIDWDLEAPGLDVFYGIDKTKINLGLIDLFYKYTNLVRKDDDIEIDELPVISNEYLIPIYKDRLWLLPAGNYNGNYNQMVRDFDWDEFYSLLSGKMYIEFIKENLHKSDFDYVFIDSRTGINDYSGICNVQMPDANVLVVAPTMQNIEGAGQMASKIINAPYTKEEFRTPIIIPILSRLDTTETEAAVWFDKFKTQFKDTIDNFIDYLIEKDEINSNLIDTFIEKTMLEYKTGISFGEKILFADKNIEIKPITLENKFREIAEIIDYINSKNKKSESNFINILMAEKSKMPKNLTVIPEFYTTGVVSRNEIIDEITAMLDNSSKPVLITGLGGVGKTTIAKAIIHKYIPLCNHVIWIDCTAGIINAMALNDVLLQNLQINQSIETTPDSCLINKRFTTISAKLRNIEGPNVLVIDNAGPDIQEPGVYENICLYPNWKVLVTSRLVLPNFETYKLDIPEISTAKSIFKHYYSAKVKEDELEELLEMIGCHTLTIELLAKTLEDNFALDGLHQIIDYIKNDKLKDEDWQISVNIPYSGKERSIFKHLINAFRLGAMDDNQKWIITQFSVLPSVDIHGKDLMKYLDINQDKRKSFVDGLKFLVEKGWLQARSKHHFYAHPVVKEVIRYKLKPDADKCRQLIKWYIDALSVAPSENPIDKTANVQFAESIVSNINSADNDIAALANNLGYLYIYLGDYPKSLELHQRAIKIREEILDELNPDLATSYNNIAFTYYNLKLYDKALEYNEKTIAIREKILLPEHPDLALSYNNIAGAYCNLNEFEKAIEFHKKAISILENVLPENHPDLAQTFNNIAVTYSNIGDYTTSLMFDQKAIDIREKVLDKNHPDLALSYYNIAASYKDLKEFQKSLEYDYKAIKIREKIFDKSHPSLAQSYNNIAVTLHNMGEYKKALHFNKKAISIEENNLKPNHPDLALSYHNIAGTYYALEKYEDALVFNLKSLVIRAEILNDNHVDLISSYNNLANTYYKLKKYDLALENYQKAVGLMIERKDYDENALALTLNNLAATQYLKHDYKNAIENGEKAIRIQEKNQKQTGVDLGLAYHNLALAYYQNTDYKKAKHFIEKAIQVRKEQLPENHPEIGRSMECKNNIDSRL